MNPTTISKNAAKNDRSTDSTRRAPSRLNGLRAEPRRETNPSPVGVRGENGHQLPMLAAAFLLLAAAAQAYPPAPDHMFYGLVRNEWGDPINLSGATVTIVSTNGPGAIAPVAASTEPGINYRLTVPMDSGRSLKVDPVTTSGLRQNQPFQLKVQIGATTYLPIEMQVTRPIGDPAGITRLDLTLGVDSDGDGLPDAWELANGLNPNDPNDADSDADGDGISNRKEYQSGTYAFDPNDGFRLALVSQIAGNATLEFLAIGGRTYSLLASSDLKEWIPVNFQVLNAGVPGALQDHYSAADVRLLQVNVPDEPDTAYRYFKAVVY